MDALFVGKTALEIFFLICAIGGGILFVIQLMLQFLGSIGGTLDVSDSISDSDLSFKFLSLQGMTAFFTMFGLVGLAVLQNPDASEVVALVAALAAGFAMVWILQRLFLMMGGLQSRGNLNLSNAIGKEGTVYLNITPPERGKVELTIQNRLRVMDAITENGEAITTGERVRVVKVFDSNVLVVERLNPASETPPAQAS